MIVWKKYIDLEPIRRLPYEGRELLGKTIYHTEKRDGSNISLMLNKNNLPVISSHNKAVPDKSLYARMKSTPEYLKAVELLKDEKLQWHRNLILYGELLQKLSPTRLEPKRKYERWILFDIYDRDTGTFDPYEHVYQLGYHFKIPVVRCIDKFIPLSMGELQQRVQDSLKWCAKHRREGIVGKCREGIFYKEKRDIPSLPKIPHQARPVYPPMPEDRILRGIQHAYDECIKNGWEWRDKSKAMPLVAKHLTLEAREHYYESPKSFYSWYCDTPLEKLTNISV